MDKKIRDGVSVGADISSTHTLPLPTSKPAAKYTCRPSFSSDNDSTVASNSVHVSRIPESELRLPFPPQCYDLKLKTCRQLNRHSNLLYCIVP